METIKRILLLFFLLVLVLSYTFLPFVVGGELLFAIFLAFPFLLFILSVVLSLVMRTPFTISSRFTLSTLVVSVIIVFVVFCILKWMPRFEDPVSEEQARVMAVHCLKSNRVKGPPEYVFMRKGHDAGEIGYYVFEVKGEKKAFLIIPADARFSSFYYRDDGLPYLDFYRRYSHMPSRLPQFNNTPLLKLKSLGNTILFRKSKEQRAWGEVLEKMNKANGRDV